MPDLDQPQPAYREQGAQGLDAGYDSDMSLEAYDLSEGPNTEGEASDVSLCWRFCPVFGLAGLVTC